MNDRDRDTMADAREDSASSVAGDDDAGQVYERLLARRRRWAGRDRAIEVEDAVPQAPAQQQDPPQGADADTDSQPGPARAEEARPKPRAAGPRTTDPRTTDPRADDPRADDGREASGAGGAAIEGEGFDLGRWQPRSHTVRFIKEHPALSLAIAIPAVVLLARKGTASRALRYASSPAGMERIRQVSTVITALGLLDKARR